MPNAPDSDERQKRNTIRVVLLGLFCALLFWQARLGHTQEGKPKPGKPPAQPISEPSEKEEEAKKEYPVPERVKIGVYINDIQSIDLKTHTYSVDAYFWFRWNNPELDPASSMEFINPSELWGHVATPNYEEPVELPSGELYQVVRVQGRFSKKLPLYNYPFDRQTLEIVFEDSVSEAKELVYEMEGDGVTINPDLVLPGYELSKPSMKVADRPYPTNFGDLRNTTPSSFFRATVDIPISRPMVAYASKLFLPVFCVILCAALMFILAPSYIDSRIDVGITSLLTVVALQMTFNQDLPDVGYLMLMDKVYLCSYLFVIAGLTVVVRTTKLVDSGDTARALQVHRLSLGIAGGAYLLVTGIITMFAIIEG